MIWPIPTSGPVSPVADSLSQYTFEKFIVNSTGNVFNSFFGYCFWNFFGSNCYLGNLFGNSLGNIYGIFFANAFGYSFGYYIKNSFRIFLAIVMFYLIKCFCFCSLIKRSHFSECNVISFLFKIFVFKDK